MTLRTALLATLAIVVSTPSPAAAEIVESDWHDSLDRMWTGSSFWANRLQDWQVRDGRLECVETRWLPMRTVHLLTHHVADPSSGLRMEVTIGALHDEAAASTDAAAGFLVGVGSGEMDHRAAAIVHGFAGRGAGLFAGIERGGYLVLRDNEHELSEPRILARAKFGMNGWSDRGVKLSLAITPQRGAPTDVQLSAEDLGTGSTLSIGARVLERQVTGNVALASHPGTKEHGETAGRFWFGRWTLLGDDLVPTGMGGLGPIISTQHTLSRGVMTLTAQLVPLGDDDETMVRFEAEGAGRHETIVVRPGYTATFRIEDWPDDADRPFTVSYRMRDRDGDATVHTWSGTIRRDPVDEPEIVLAAMSCNHNNSHDLGGGWGARDLSKKGNWVEGMWFPHADLVERVAKHDPDVLFFAGDQVYEGASPSFADRRKIEHDYLYKWYLWCWAYRDLTRDIPCVVIPDDHDVYQGNIWGHGGRKTQRDNQGGYVHPARFVKMVERTQTSNLPPPFDPRPIDQGIGVYFTELNYGRVSFAVLEDRKFKSGCADPDLPPSGTRRPDHFNDPGFDTTRLDLPKFTLLGERQLAFLDAWAADWRTSDLKVALSQTVFANLATHHGKGLQPLIADLDSNGWPQAGRRRAIERLRQAFSIHVGGDQHLSTLAQHGLDDHRDAIWSFCMPAAANFYPRQWLPPREGTNRPDGAPPWLGDHHDGFENLVTMYAVTNPRETGRLPKALHDGMPGYGIIRMNKPARTYTFECWPRYADPDAAPGTGHDQYEGWPITIEQADNDGRTPTGFLPELRVSGLDDPVVRVYDGASGELVHALRVRGRTHRPKVYGPGPFRVEVGCPDRDRWQTLDDVGPVDAADEAFVEVAFEPGAAGLANGVKIGEVTRDTAVVWVRTTAHAEALVDDAELPWAVPGTAGDVRLALWPTDAPDAASTTEWTSVSPDRDFTHQFELTGLRPGTRYELRAETGAASVEGRFRTAPTADEPRRIVFTVVTGQGFHRRDDPASGHRIYPAMAALDPDFFVHTGDVVYYDKPGPFAKDVALARYKWNRMYALPFQRDFHRAVACYFLRDDHDTLKDDCFPGQRYGELTWDDGLRLFREQVPTGPRPYRTIRWGRDLQIWLLEGREFRDANRAPDGPDKTLLGRPQLEWLTRTLAESDATFRLVISATPLVGPDRSAKMDSHANRAFATEGARLRRMLADLDDTYVVCGDRHWQYVSADPETGLVEYSCGPTSDAHAGGFSNQPRAMHRFLRVKGGFLSVTIDRRDGAATATFRHHDVTGAVVNEEDRRAGPDPS